MPVDVRPPYTRVQDGAEGVTCVDVESLWRIVTSPKMQLHLLVGVLDLAVNLPQSPSGPNRMFDCSGR